MDTENGSLDKNHEKEFMCLDGLLMVSQGPDVVNNKSLVAIC